MEIKVSVKSVYGEQRIYPACERSLIFAAIAGTKTLAQSDLKLIKQLGFNVVFVESSEVVKIKGSI